MLMMLTLIVVAAGRLAPPSRNNEMKWELSWLVERQNEVKKKHIHKPHLF